MRVQIRQAENSLLKRKLEGYERLRQIVQQRPRQTSLDVSGVLYGYLLGHLDIETQEQIAKNFFQTFGWFKNKLTERALKEKDAILLVYDIIYEIELTHQGQSEHRLEDLPQLFRKNTHYMIGDPQFIKDKWQLQQELFLKEQKTDIDQGHPIREGSQAGEGQGQQNLDHRNGEQSKRQKNESQQPQGKKRVEVIQQVQNKMREEDKGWDVLWLQYLRRDQDQDRKPQRANYEEQKKHRMFEEERIKIPFIAISRCLDCNRQCQPEKLVELSCGHTFHPACLMGYTSSIFESNSIKMSCPARDCHQELTTNQIEHYIDPSLKEKYLQSANFDMVAKNEGTMAWCPGLGCRQIMEYDAESRTFRCHNCRKDYCLRCGQEHNRMSCIQYQARNGPPALRINPLEPKFKKCPLCGAWVERLKDSLRTVCQCGNRFCFKCLGRGCSDLNCESARTIVINIDED